MRRTRPTSQRFMNAMTDYVLAIAGGYSKKEEERAAAAAVTDMLSRHVFAASEEPTTLPRYRKRLALAKAVDELFQRLTP